MEESDTPSAPKSNRLAAVVPIWAALLFLIYLVWGWQLIRDAHAQKLDAIDRHSKRIGEVNMSPAPGPVDEVKVGVYVDRVSELSIKETGWTVDFYIWFLWKNKDLAPGESFQVIEGEIESREKAAEANLPDGTMYAQDRVKARMTKFFTLARFPADDHLLTIRIEDKGRPIELLRYVGDKENSSVSSRVNLPGYKGYESTVVVQPHSYKTTRGDPRLKSGQSTFSQFIFGIWIKRDGFGVYLKLFQGLFAAVGIAFLALFIKPTDVDPRFGLGVGAFFAAVANAYITAQQLPDSGMMTLADAMNGFGMGTIFLSLIQSTLSLYLYDIRGEEALSKKLDKISAVIFLIGYTVINIIVPRVAMI